jgi:ATP-dependent DNA helicase RecQ
MKDQVDGLRRRGIAAVAVHSGMDSRQIEIALDNATYGDVKLLYIAPERLATEAFRVRLRNMKVSIIAVDEAHCISQWGYDFRPSYLRIAEIRELQPKATVLALTASATEHVAQDIMHHLHFNSECILRSSFARPNLSYAVRDAEDKMDQIERVLNNVGGSGIVYMRTREGCEQLCEQLKQKGHSVQFYHAGLPSMERSIRQDEWQQNKVRVMVATNAFGMGIDKADVRFVIHYALCDSLEAYYQEAGRAGRDGERSYALLLSTKDDADRVTRLFEAEFPEVKLIKSVYEQLMNYLQVAIGDGEGGSFPFNIYDFCHKCRLSISRVSGALKILELNGLLTLVEENDNPAKLMFTCSRDTLYSVNAGGNDMDRLLRAILRTYNGVFTHFCSIKEQEIAHMSQLSMERVHDLLKMLWRMHVIRYIPSSRTPMIYLDSERLPTADVYIAPETYRQRYDMAVERFENILRYATTSDVCRSQIIENYFGDKSAKPCGVCDVCLARRRRLSKGEDVDHEVSIESAVMQCVAQQRLGVKEVVGMVEGDSDLIVQTIDRLLRDGKLAMSINGKLEVRDDK